MKRFFSSNYGLASGFVLLIILGALMATLSTSLNVLGALFALLGLAGLGIWAFVTGRL